MVIEKFSASVSYLRDAVTIRVCLPRLFNANLSLLVFNKKLSMAVVPPSSELNLVFLLYTKKLSARRALKLKLFLCGF